MKIKTKQQEQEVRWCTWFVTFYWDLEREKGAKKKARKIFAN